jgi:hypothetical protein
LPQLAGIGSSSRSSLTGTPRQQNQLGRSRRRLVVAAAAATALFGSGSWQPAIGWVRAHHVVVVVVLACVPSHDVGVAARCI